MEDPLAVGELQPFRHLDADPGDAPEPCLTRRHRAACRRGRGVLCGRRGTSRPACSQSSPLECLVEGDRRERSRSHRVRAGSFERLGIVSIRSGARRVPSCASAEHRVRRESSDHAVEALAVDVLQGVIEVGRVLAHAEDGHDVRVVQLGRGARLRDGTARSWWVRGPPIAAGPSTRPDDPAPARSPRKRPHSPSSQFSRIIRKPAIDGR